MPDSLRIAHLPVAQQRPHPGTPAPASRPPTKPTTAAPKPPASPWRVQVAAIADKSCDRPTGAEAGKGGIHGLPGARSARPHQGPGGAVRHPGAGPAALPRIKAAVGGSRLRHAGAVIAAPPPARPARPALPLPLRRPELRLRHPARPGHHCRRAHRPYPPGDPRRRASSAIRRWSSATTTPSSTPDGTVRRFSIDNTLSQPRRPRTGRPSSPTSSISVTTRSMSPSAAATASHRRGRRRGNVA